MTPDLRQPAPNKTLLPFGEYGSAAAWPEIGAPPSDVPADTVRPACESKPGICRQCGGAGEICGDGDCEKCCEAPMLVNWRRA